MARVRLCVQNIDGGICCLLCLIAVGVPLFTIVSFAACQPVQVWECVSVWAELLIAACLESPLAGCWVLGAGSGCLFQTAAASTALAGHCPQVPFSTCCSVTSGKVPWRGGDLPSPPCIYRSQSETALCRGVELESKICVVLMDLPSPPRKQMRHRNPMGLPAGKREESCREEAKPCTSEACRETGISF